MKSILVCSVLVLYQLGLVVSLECSGKVKVTVKLTNPDLFDDQEQFLFKGITAYALQEYCLTDASDGAAGCPLPGTNTVMITDVTPRFAMCVEATGFEMEQLLMAMNISMPRYLGGLQLTEDVFLVEGIPPILAPIVEPDFPTWLIPYIVITALILIAAIVIITYSVYQEKHAAKQKPVDESSEEDSKLRVDVDADGDAPVQHVYENEVSTEL